MDPDTTLEELRVLTRRLLDHADCPDERYVVADCADITRAAELLDGLDAWLVRGGALPRRWAGGRVPR